MKYRLLIDLATDRIIWYTSDLETPINNDDHSAIAEYDGDLIEGMTLQNCWNYGYQNKVLSLFNKPAVKPTLLESNRSSIRQLLIDKINEKRASIKFNLRYSDYVELMTYNEAQLYNGSNLLDLQWLSLAIKHGDAGIDTEQAIKIIKFDFNEKRNILLLTETFYLETLDQIKKATTNDELFQIRTEIQSRIGAM